ncbi:MAG TPA: GNAT family N-acetyltransferase [Candidatus Acidoferrales bacterium]|nr:GNAT family N-acetyltransferase [Candidatus Acidoferrales bacterium]
MIDFLAVEPEHYPMLWEWLQRPHVAAWFAHFSPSTYEGMVQEQMDKRDGTEASSPNLILLDGVPVGYIQGYRWGDFPEITEPLALSGDAVGADLYLADPELVGRGLGPRVVARFYLRLMEEMGLDLGFIDPEVDNARAIRAYEKAGFTFLRSTDGVEPRDRLYLMQATRDDLERALTSLERRT